MPWIQRPDGTSIHSQVTGRADAAPVLLIQGLGMDKNGWALQRIAMATKYRTIAVDNRGAGRSSIPHQPFTLEDMA
ncbi:MAG: alpha/beta hydrolase, partial [Acidimicrobiia bacterium]|nr:alpha/beta hydrolase [Acidimicrobiia bacterium]